MATNEHMYRYQIPGKATESLMGPTTASVKFVVIGLSSIDSGRIARQLMKDATEAEIDASRHVLSTHASRELAEKSLKKLAKDPLNQRMAVIEVTDDAALMSLIDEAKSCDQEHAAWRLSVGDIASARATLEQKIAAAQALLAKLS